MDKELYALPWVSVEDRLPDEYDEVLVWCTGDGSHYHRNIAYLVETTSGVMGWSQNYDVTHWMPLPEPPEADNG